MKKGKKLIVYSLCLMMLLSASITAGSQKASAKTYEAADFGLGYNVEKYIGVKFIKVTKKYVIYEKYIFNGNDGLKHVNKKKYKKKYNKNIKMYILKPGYPSTWVKACNGFTYKNINKYRTKDSHVKFKNSYWILRGNNMLQYYTP